MKKEHILPLLKIIGVFVFGWILYHIDRPQLFATLSVADPLPIALALLSLAGLCTAKTIRWHLLVRATGMHPTFGESWKIFFIGTFLGSVTPAKVGEFGRAAYLKKRGLPLKIGVLLSLIDRASDAVIIVALGVAGLGILGRPEWSLILLAVLAFAGAMSMALLLKKKLFRIKLSLASFFARFVRSHIITNVTFATALAWVFYFLWAVLLARSVGIETATHLLIAIITITGLFSLLPIAPSGLGTRDAALVLLLAPYGVPAEQAVALAMLMFVTILLMSVPGGWYWVREKH